MNTEILDKQEIEGIKKLRPETLIVTGIFFYITLTTTTHLIDLVLRDLFVFSKVIHVAVFWLKELIIIGIVFGVMSVTARKFKAIDNQKIVKKYLKTIVITLIIVQLLQVLYPIFRLDIWQEGFIGKSSAYFDATRNLSLSETMFQMIFGYIQYLIIGLFLIKK